MQLLKITSSCRGALNLKGHLVRRLFTQVRVENSSLGSSDGHSTVKENDPVADAASLQHTDKPKTNPSGSSSLSNVNVSNASKLVFDKKQQYAIDKALTMLKEASTSAGFDETIEVCFQLNIDDRKPEQRIKDKILYPVSPIKHTLVAVFTKDPQETQVAQEAGADYIGYEELLQRIRKRRFKFYWLVSTPASVKGLAPVSKILGPRGMMPTEKMGTLTEDIDFAVREFKKGYLRIENDPDSNVHSVLGKKSWSVESMITNCCYLYEFLSDKKPRAIKKNYFVGLTVSSTMGPGIQVDLNSVRELVNKKRQDDFNRSSKETAMLA